MDEHQVIDNGPHLAILNLEDKVILLENMASRLATKLGSRDSIAAVKCSRHVGLIPVCDEANKEIRALSSRLQAVTTTLFFAFEDLHKGDK